MIAKNSTLLRIGQILGAAIAYVYYAMNRSDVTMVLPARESARPLTTMAQRQVLMQVTPVR